MTDAQKQLARHALGLPNRHGQSYRNRFLATVGNSNHVEWMAMVAAGDAERGDGSFLRDWFHLTPQGAKAALHHNERLCAEDFPGIES